MSYQFGIIQAPQAFLYQKAGAPDGSNSSSIEDEVLSGWFVKLLSSDNEGWYYAETHYGYRAFLSASAVSLCEEAAVKERAANAQIRRVAVPEADVLSQPKVQGSLLETLPCCAVLEVLAAADLPNGWCLVRTASGCEGYMQEAHLTVRTDSDAGLLRAEDDGQFFADAAASVLASLDADGEAALRRKITDSARSYLGTQYRWGGKSHRGIDCSGLVFMSYLENGLLLFRDAAIKDGYPVHEIPREA
ncbi:MAG: NlpC/P60 family protein, partial [Lachnospiraceae bacterium]|nr:NlpC/P60 family protein [Lachnospiraceae bacterium]